MEILIKSNIEPILISNSFIGQYPSFIKKSDKFIETIDILKNNNDLFYEIFATIIIIKTKEKITKKVVLKNKKIEKQISKIIKWLEYNKIKDYYNYISKENLLALAKENNIPYGNKDLMNLYFNINNCTRIIFFIDNNKTIVYKQKLILYFKDNKELFTINWELYDGFPKTYSSYFHAKQNYKKELKDYYEFPLYPKTTWIDVLKIIGFMIIGIIITFLETNDKEIVKQRILNFVILFIISIILWNLIRALIYYKKTKKYK